MSQLPRPLKLVSAASAVVVFVGLIAALVFGIASNVDSQLVKLGEAFWPGYASEIRTEPDVPTCELDDLDSTIAECGPEESGSATPSDGAGDDPFAGEDPFAEPGAAPDDTPPDGADPFAGEDPFADPAPAADIPDDIPADIPADGADPFAGEDPFADPAPATDIPADGADPFAGEDPFAEPVAAVVPSGGPSSSECEALRAYRDTCAGRWDSYNATIAKQTPTNLAFRSVEIAVGSLALVPSKPLLVILVLVGALATTVHRMHIALREPRTRLEHYLAHGAQLLSFLLLAASNVADLMVQSKSGAEAQGTELPIMWGVGFALLALVSVYHLVRPPQGLDGEPSVSRGFMVIPLFAYMAVGSGVYFLLVEQHYSGQAIYLHKFLQFPVVYLGIGLYIWAGMLFSITRVATLTFNVLTPWKLPPAILAWLVIVLAAVPTAYSGASGIFVLAAGAVIFHQLTRAGATKRIALAATAMSGSLGVVLAPCLVVVLIAMLNKQVTTVELFNSGLYVFALTALLALIALLVRNKDPFQMPVFGDAFRGTGRALLALLPFALLGAFVIVFYWYVFGTDLSEHTAMLVLPAALLALVIYDRTFAAAKLDDVELPKAGEGLWRPVLDATAESSHHIGALLMLMACSVALGGLVERTEIMSLFPQSMGGPYITMAVLVLVMIVVGMTMDALGAVVLVSVSVATLAYDSGIHPVHFWMMVLVAFELGYLTPPVALNHLLARQVIGEASHVEDEEGGTFYHRYEHVILPMVVMGAALVVVAFVPFLFYTPGQ